jgi:hypothetical protein
MLAVLQMRAAVSSFNAAGKTLPLRRQGYAESTLGRLTWRNLGYRFGQREGRQSLDAIDAVYRVLAQSYGRLWVPRSNEDHLLRSYWQCVGGRIYVEVPIGAVGGARNRPAGSTRRRLDGVRFLDSKEPAIVRFSDAEFRNRIGSSNVELIEVKPGLNRSVIGQVVAGRDIFRQDYGVAVHCCVVVCGASDGALEWVCREHDIAVNVVQSSG